MVVLAEWNEKAGILSRRCFHSNFRVWHGAS
jgi:hypothetical protein